MIRKFSSMGLALVTALAVTAVMASGAIAAEFHSADQYTNILPLLRFSLQPPPANSLDALP